MIRAFFTCPTIYETCLLAATIRSFFNRHSHYDFDVIDEKLSICLVIPDVFDFFEVQPLTRQLFDYINAREISYSVKSYEFEKKQK